MTSIVDLEKKAYLAFKPPKKLNLNDWACENAYLSAESSAEPGRWRSLPYQVGIMNALTDPTVEQITVMKSARVGYTKILNHFIAYHIENDPCGILACFPTLDDCNSYSKDEIAPLLRDTPCLHGLVSDPKSKDGQNTLLKKNFPGGTLQLVGSNSARGFRMVSRRIVLFDEVDGYAPSAGTEGDQIKLGIKRTEFFSNRKIVAGSTPTVKDFSRIEKLFKESDQRRYFVPCYKCGHMQYLDWKNFVCFDDDPMTTVYKCKSCEQHIPHSKKRWMIERGEWRATSPGKAKHRGFHIWAAYSYSPNATWSHLMKEYLDCKDDPEQLKTFINTTLGECYEEQFYTIATADDLMKRAAKETYEATKPPEECKILCMGIDVQDDRLSMSVFGYGGTYINPEMWLIDRKVIYGSPSRFDLWNQLTEVLKNKYKRVDGLEMKISLSAIDTGGHFTQETYAAIRERLNLNLIGIKGQSQKDKPPIGKPTVIDKNSKGQPLKRGAIQLYPVGVSVIKTTLHNKLKDAEIGKGYIHFYPTITPDYFEELTAEKQVYVRKKNGYITREWQKKSRVANEALDEAVYSYAAYCRLLQTFDPRTIFQQFDRTLKEQKLKKDDTLRLKGKRTSKRSNFVSNW